MIQIDVYVPTVNDNIGKGCQYVHRNGLLSWIFTFKRIEEFCVGYIEFFIKTENGNLYHV